MKHSSPHTTVKQTQAAAGQFEQAVEAIVSRVVDARLRALGVVVTVPEYSTANPRKAVMPPELSDDPNGRRTFNRWCRTRVDGAVPEAQGWRCSVADWRTARSTAKKRGAKPIVDCADEDIAKAMIVASRRGSK